jgi:hypothetical protein
MTEGSAMDEGAENAVRWFCLACRLLLLWALVPEAPSGFQMVSIPQPTCPAFTEAKQGRLAVISLHLMLVAVGHEFNIRRAQCTSPPERAALAAMQAALVAIAAQIALRCAQAWAIFPVALEAGSLMYKEALRLKVKLQSMAKARKAAGKSSGERVLLAAFDAERRKQASDQKPAPGADQPRVTIASEQPAAVRQELAELNAFLSEKIGGMTLRPVNEGGDISSGKPTSPEVLVRPMAQRVTPGTDSRPWDSTLTPMAAAAPRSAPATERAERVAEQKETYTQSSEHPSRLSPGRELFMEQQALQAEALKRLAEARQKSEELDTVGEIQAAAPSDVLEGDGNGDRTTGEINTWLPH